MALERTLHTPGASWGQGRLQTRMPKQLADGEYDLDFSGLFSTVQSDVFGIRYGFKPDTIDEAFPSFLYKDVAGPAHQMSPKRGKEAVLLEPGLAAAEIPFYLMSESKESTKAITTNLSKDDHIYFEGRSRPNAGLHQLMSTAMTPTGTSSTSTITLENGAGGGSSHFGSMSEFLLSYDDVSKSFKVDVFNGFIKMNKSREPEVVSGKINKIAHRQTKLSNASSPAAAAASPMTKSYIDSLITSFASDTSSKPGLGSSRRTTSPVRSANIIPSEVGVAKSYGKSISGISPVRRHVPNSPIGSPTKNAFQPSKTLSPVLVSAPPPTVAKPQSPLRVSSSPSPVLQTAKKNGSTPTNGGMGTRKTQRSLLLRKAERAVGINKGRVYKPKLKEPAPKEKEIFSNPVDASHKTSESTGLRIRQRELKEARPDQAAFELVLTPPPSLTPKKEVSLQRPVKKAARVIGKDVKKVAKIQPTPLEKRKLVLSDDDLDLDSFAEELESEMNTAPADEGVEAKSTTSITAKPTRDQKGEAKSTTPNFRVEGDPKADSPPPPLPPSHSPELEISPVIAIDRSTDKTADALDDDFNIEFSDWEDADAIDGPVLSDENELTAGNNEFQLIIEDDPLKSKEMKERKERKQMQKEEPSMNRPVSRPREQVKVKTKPVKSVKPAKNENTVKLPTPTSTPTLVPASAPSPKATTNATKKNTTVSSATPKKTPKAKAAGKLKKKTGTPQKARHGGLPHEDDDIDRELDAELDKAFDDLLDEEDMSEEE